MDILNFKAICKVYKKKEIKILVRIKTSHTLLGKL